VLSKSGRMLPLGRQADGFLAGEGCALFCIETEESAREHGATIMAEIAGYAQGFDPETSVGAWSDEVARHVMKAACDDAGISVHDIGFVAAGANATKANDELEAMAIRDVLGDVPITAYKARTGECYAASPAIAVACALADMRAGRIIGVPRGYELMPAAMCVQGVMQGRDDRYVLVNAFSCDGNCTSIVLKKA
jgi:3-oxoacyl-(acyl-carrier-protein) synthase